MWGNIAVEETVDVRHSGAQLKVTSEQTLTIQKFDKQQKLSKFLEKKKDILRFLFRF